MRYKVIEVKTGEKFAPTGRIGKFFPLVLLDSNTYQNDLDRFMKVGRWAGD